MSIRSAREKLASENEHRDDLLQKARMVRSKLVSGKGSLSKILPLFYREFSFEPVKSAKRKRLAGASEIGEFERASLGRCQTCGHLPDSINKARISVTLKRPRVKNTIYRTTYVIQINPPQSSPHVPPLNYKTSSLSMPASLASGRSSTSSRTRQNDRLVRLVTLIISKELKFCGSFKNKDIEPPQPHHMLE